MNIQRNLPAEIQARDAAKQVLCGDVGWALAREVGHETLSGTGAVCLCGGCARGWADE